MLDSTDEFIGGELFDEDVVTDEDGGRFGDAAGMGFEQIGVYPGGLAAVVGSLHLADGEQAAATPGPFGLSTFGEPEELGFFGESAGGGVLDEGKIAADELDGFAEGGNELIVEHVLQARAIGALQVFEDFDGDHLGGLPKALHEIGDDRFAFGETFVVDMMPFLAGELAPEAVELLKAPAN